jgi:hypothetical protein
VTPGGGGCKGMVRGVITGKTEDMVAVKKEENGNCEKLLYPK